MYHNYSNSSVTDMSCNVPSGTKSVSHLLFAVDHEPVHQELLGLSILPLHPQIPSPDMPRQKEDDDGKGN